MQLVPQGISSLLSPQESLKSHTCSRSTHLRFWHACCVAVQGELDGRVCGPKGVGGGLPRERV